MTQSELSQLKDGLVISLTAGNVTMSVYPAYNNVQL